MDRTLQQLTDMFSGISHGKILETCNQFNWILEDCIDHLIKVSEQSDIAADSFDSWSSRCFQFKNGAIPKSECKVLREPPKKPSENARKTYDFMKRNNNASDVQRVSEHIASGFRVMILMRGASGSGKSTLARSLVEKYVQFSTTYSLKDFILSTDDLFIDAYGRYKFSFDKLSELHAQNRDRALQRALAGWSPIIIDNTNIQLWEMLPYVQIAISNGYIVEILEPKTPWCNSATKLAMKSQHGVPVDKIYQMLNKYEKTSSGDLIKMVKNAKYTVPLPQFRLHPPVVKMPNQVFQTEEKSQSIEKTGSNHVSPNTDMFVSSFKKLWRPEENCSIVDSKNNQDHIEINKLTNEDCGGIEHSRTMQKDFSWRPHEEEIYCFWGKEQNKLTPNCSVEGDGVKNEQSMMTLLKYYGNNVANLDRAENNIDPMSKDHSIFEMHRTNCPNENKSFAEFRQIYPNKRLTGLWDLFIKCNGDIDWAVDILLKEDELSIGRDAIVETDIDCDDAMTCFCQSDGVRPNRLSKESMSVGENTNQTFGNIKPQRQRNKPGRQNQRASKVKLDEVKDTVEGLFVFVPGHDSEQVRKMRDSRNGVNHINSTVVAHTEVGTQTDVPDEDDIEEEVPQLLEVVLGDTLVQQLCNNFTADTSATKVSHMKTPLKVFMPTTLAKELYMLCLESTYNQLEEQRQQTIREDEEFARLLKIPKYENCKESPSNTRELLDMEMAWAIYNNDKKQELQQAQKLCIESRLPEDLASYLSHMKLCEQFPDIPRETLLTILAAHGNRYGETVEVLLSTICDNNGSKVLTQEKMLERAINENELLNRQVESQGNQQESYDRGHAPLQHSSSSSTVIKYSLQPDEAKRQALKNFEESRNLAAHHCQLKAECYQKAKEAIQKGNSGVAIYYSQIADLHKKKIHMYNHQAAGYIIEVHKYTQNNPDLLDLHYLHALEAIGCLDLFLDRHITGLRNTSHSYKHVFIITGRGLHSTGGISTIKNKVKNRLRERQLRWSEVNPGLLKVKIFSASKHSRNV